MKKLIVSLLVLVSTSAFGARDICGVSVQDNNIKIANQDMPSATVNFVRALFLEDNATVYECFEEDGAFVVGIFPNGEIRAIRW